MMKIQLIELNLSNIIVLHGLQLGLAKRLFWNLNSTGLPEKYGFPHRNLNPIVDVDSKSGPTYTILQ